MCFWLSFHCWWLRYGMMVTCIMQYIQLQYDHINAGFAIILIHKAVCYRCNYDNWKSLVCVSIYDWLFSSSLNIRHFRHPKISMFTRTCHLSLPGAR
jgi:hypothetical protein